MTERPQHWQLETVTLKDLVEAIAAGVRDFRAAPRFGLLFAGIYVVSGWLLIALLFWFGLPYLAYPLVMGFALIAPFAVVGLYAVSQQLQCGTSLTWPGILQAMRAASRRDLRWMALVTGFALVIWMDIAAFLMFAFVGFHGVGTNLLNTIFTTPSGLAFLLIGNVSGALIAAGLFSIAAISFPMLYERDIDFITAMTTSVHLVVANPGTMLTWCAIIGLSIGLSLASGLLGLFVTLPIIGHATWHLYQRAVRDVPPDESAPRT